MKNPVERLRCANVVAERFLDDDTSALGGTRFRQIAQPLFRTEGANGQVMRRLSRSIQFFADRLKRGRGLRSRRPHTATTRSTCSGLPCRPRRVYRGGLGTDRVVANARGTTKTLLQGRHGKNSVRRQDHKDFMGHERLNALHSSNGRCGCPPALYVTDGASTSHFLATGCRVLQPESPPLGTLCPQEIKPPNRNMYLCAINSVASSEM